MYIHLKYQHETELNEKKSLLPLRTLLLCPVNPKKNYQNIARDYGAQASYLRKQLRIFSLIRLMVFVVTAVGVWQTLSTDWWWTILLVGFVVFLVLVRRHLKIKDQLDRVDRVVTFANREIQWLEASIKDFSGGEEFIDHQHPYATDLNIFGKGSLYGYLNRTVSFQGAEWLSQELKENVTDRESLLSEREKVKEFATRPEFVFRFLAAVQAAGENHSKNPVMPELIPHSKVAEWIVTKVLPFVMIGFTAALIFGVITFNQYLLSLLLSALPVMFRLKKHMSDFKAFDPILQSAKAYKESLELLDKAEVNSEELKREFREAELESSAEAIVKLEGIKEAIDSRNNIFVGIILNLLLLWDFQQHRRLVKWSSEWKHTFPHWMDLVHRMEAQLSLSIYVHNHPEFIYPEFTESDICEFEEVRHVALGENAIPNSLSIKEDGRLAIITGANMAGKSTFLRTIGTNLVLAMRGLPVPAKQFRFKPRQIFTSMLTMDSLSEGESYFFSELSRLKMMTDILESGTPLFVILDEILKGTNSIDKAEGSKLFTQKLLKLPAKGLIATHDLSLCEMEKEHPVKIQNLSFEVEFREDQLQFDYRIRKGVCQNMNAKFLLKRMGLTDS